MDQSVFEFVVQHTQISLFEHVEHEPQSMKAFSVRLPERYLNLLDKIAEDINVSRNTLVSEIICQGTEEALQGYASCFSDPKKVSRDMLSEAGFCTSNWDSPSQDKPE